MNENIPPSTVEGGSLPLNAFIEGLTPKVGKFVAAVDPAVYKVDSLLIAAKGKPLTNRSPDAFFTESVPIVHRPCYPALFGVLACLSLKEGEMAFVHAYPLEKVLSYKADEVCKRLGELWLVPDCHVPASLPVVASIYATVHAGEVSIGRQLVKRQRWIIRIQSGTHYLSKGIKLQPGYYEATGLDPLMSGQGFLDQNVFEVKPASPEAMATFPVLRAAVLGSTLPPHYQWSQEP